MISNTVKGDQPRLNWFDWWTSQSSFRDLHWTKIKMIKCQSITFWINLISTKSEVKIFLHSELSNHFPFHLKLNSIYFCSLLSKVSIDDPIASKSACNCTPYCNFWIPFYTLISQILAKAEQDSWQLNHADIRIIGEQISNHWCLYSSFLYF